MNLLNSRFGLAIQPGVPEDSLVEGLSRKQLEALVNRDSLIGVTQATAP